jgi:hypothetical protein
LKFGAIFIVDFALLGARDSFKKASDSTFIDSIDNLLFNETELLNTSGDTKENNPNNESETTSKKLDSSLQFKTPIYPQTPVKIYNNAKESKLDIVRDFKDKTIIYMLLNKKTGKVYIGSGVDGSARLSRYFMPSVLKSSNSLIYKNILKYGHDSFMVIIMEEIGESKSVSKSHYLAREQFYLDWALKNYGLLVLNLLYKTSSSLGFKHSLETKKLISEARTGKTHSELTKQKLKKRFSGENGPF